VGNSKGTEDRDAEVRRVRRRLRRQRGRVRMG
jgi:hypothetical protein